VTSFGRSPREYEVFRIKASDTNKFALVADPQAHGTSFVTVVEIFDVGGATPPNAHAAADELFYVLHGEGVAVCDGERLPIRRGDSFLVRAGAEHVVENTGATRLYCLTTMVPDEAFAGLIRNGVPDRLDADDLAVLADRGSRTDASPPAPLVRFHNPPGIYPPPAPYSHGVEVRGASRWLLTSGTLGIDPAGEVPADFDAQCRLIWQSLRAIVASAGMTFDDVIKVNTYLRDAAYRERQAVHRRAALGDRLVASTALVCAPLDPRWLIEIEVVAVA
jgi:enamine deaminase RidA (YjgF/YER057c/UK114 family)/mannose-6-phosphate isomerase-like protein (cupin superfamily)